LSEPENQKQKLAFLNPLMVMWGLSPALILIVSDQWLGVSHMHPEDPQYPSRTMDMIMLVVLLTEIAWATMVVRRMDAHWIVRIAFIAPIAALAMYVNFIVAGVGCGVLEGIGALAR